MKTKKFIFSTVLFFAGLIFIFLLIYLSKNSKVEIRSMGDRKGIYVGGRSSRSQEINRSKWTSETRKRVEDYEADVEAVDDAHRFRMEGYRFAKLGDNGQAAAAFKKAYEIERAADSAFLLVETYAKLKRYDEAIAILDNIIKNRETNEYGIQKANEMKIRLFAVKNENIVQQPA